MELKKALKKPIRIYWWNMGKKTLDFSGSYGDYFKKRNIKIRKINKYSRKERILRKLEGEDIPKGLRFIIPVGSAIIRLDAFGGSMWVLNELDSAIKLFLTYLGDKTLFEGYTAYKLNWN